MTGGKVKAMQHDGWKGQSDARVDMGSGWKGQSDASTGTNVVSTTGGKVKATGEWTWGRNELERKRESRKRCEQRTAREERSKKVT